MTCSVCGAPALPVDGACAFCQSPLAEEGEGEGLLDYVAAHVPTARGRRGLIGRGPVTRLRVEAGGRRFSGRLRKGELELEPESDPRAWAHELVRALAADAAADHELRRALTRSGWSLAPR